MVSYVEVYGIGIFVGDFIEVNVIGFVFGKGCEGDDYLLMGFVKFNIGYLELGVGVVGFIKGVLVVFYGEVLFNISFEFLNENIKFDEYCLKVLMEVI